MIELIGTAATILAVAGVLANNRWVRACFLVWMLSNLLTGTIHAYTGIWSLLVRDVIFFVLAIEGYIKWGKCCRKMR